VAPECAPAFAWLGLPCAALWLLGYAANAGIAMQLAAVGFCQIAIVAVCGTRVARLLLWPLLSLWLLVPVDGGEALIAPTVRLTVGALQVLGFDVLAEGNRFHAGGNPYDIVAECTSFDFILGNVVISLVFANLIFRGWMRRTVYVLSAVPVALGANILRTSSVVAITEWTGGRFDLGVDHRYYSLLVFSLAVLGHMRCGLAFRDVEERPGRAVAAERLIAAMPRQTAFGLAGTLPPLALALGLPVLAIAIGPASGSALPVPLCTPAWLAPAHPDGEPTAWRPAFEGGTSRLRARRTPRRCPSRSSSPRITRLPAARR
jgi:exosortase